MNQSDSLAATFSEHDPQKPPGHVRMKTWQVTALQIPLTEARLGRNSPF